ncbi:MAG TPA: 3-deoxy-7-phosphoheptulonate synthase, partial [Candidatus Brachybacterium merdigallinarum]|nr:3-deoxy-7-phosphoheptulonate synthase [Candidatus Brachybacterium merdigallinarum]
MTLLATAPTAAPTADRHVASFTALPAPDELRADQPLDDVLTAQVAAHRGQIRDVLSGADGRLLVIVGPCSIHDPDAGIDYARRLAALRAEVQDDLLLVMRTYFEKPRTTVGWKGLINDPHLDGSHDIAAGLRTARAFLLEVARLGLPAATEFLEPISPQYIADLVS